MKFDIYILLTFVCCCGTFWACFCRLFAMDKAYRKDERAKYVALMAGSIAFGGQGPLLGEMATKADAIFAAVVFGYMLLGMWRWRHGAPPDAITGHGDFADAPETRT